MQTLTDSVNRVLSDLLHPRCSYMVAVVKKGTRDNCSKLGRGGGREEDKVKNNHINNYRFREMGSEVIQPSSYVLFIHCRKSMSDNLAYKK